MSNLDFSILRTLRVKKGLSAEDVAKASGLTRATVLKVEGANGNPTMSTVESLARYFDLSPSELIRMAENSSCEKAISQQMKRGEVEGQHISFRDFEMFYFHAKAGLAIQSDPKFHEHSREIFYLMKGKLHVTVGEEEHEMNAGDAIRFKALQYHKLLILEDSEVLMMHTNLA